MLLLMDTPGNMTHTFSDVELQEFENRGLKIMYLPPNTTHLLQPLDQDVFGNFKKLWYAARRRQQVYYLRQRHASYYNIPKWAKEPWETATSERNIKSSWKKAGFGDGTLESFKLCSAQVMKKFESQEVSNEPPRRSVIPLKMQEETFFRMRSYRETLFKQRQEEIKANDSARDKPVVRLGQANPVNIDQLEAIADENEKEKVAKEDQKHKKRLQRKRNKDADNEYENFLQRQKNDPSTYCYCGMKMNGDNDKRWVEQDWMSCDGGKKCILNGWVHFDCDERLKDINEQERTMPRKFRCAYCLIPTPNKRRRMAREQNNDSKNL